MVIVDVSHDLTDENETRLRKRNKACQINQEIRQIQLLSWQESTLPALNVMFLSKCCKGREKRIHTHTHSSRFYWLKWKVKVKAGFEVRNYGRPGGHNSIRIPTDTEINSIEKFLSILYLIIWLEPLFWHERYIYFKKFVFGSHSTKLVRFGLRNFSIFVRQVLLVYNVLLFWTPHNIRTYLTSRKNIFSHLRHPIPIIIDHILMIWAHHWICLNMIIKLFVLKSTFSCFCPSH